MFFIIQPALPRDRVFCGYHGNPVMPTWKNTSCHHAAMYETRSEAEEELENHPGAFVAELVVFVK